MARGKAFAVYAGLLLLTVWPAVHLALVARYDLSPWKLAGWGMYSEPRFSLLGMEVYGRASAQESFEQLTGATPELAAEATRFLERHRWLRRLARPDDFAAGVLRERPQWRELQIVVFRPALNRDSGMIEMVSARYEYPGSH